MEIRDWRLLLLPEEGDSIMLSREKARELLERLERLEKEKAELEEQWVAYKKRHPETVGVKFGKAYVLKTPTEPRVSGVKPGAIAAGGQRIRATRPTASRCWGTHSVIDRTFASTAVVSYRAQTKDSPQGSGPDSVTENGSILVGVLHRRSNSAPSGETRVQRTGASWLPAPPGDAPAVLLDTLRPSRALERGRLAFRGHQRPPIGISGGLFDHPFAARRVVTIYVDD